MSEEAKYRIILSLMEENGLDYIKEFRISLRKDQIVIVGRSNEAQLPIEDENASRKHFYFLIKDEQVYIQDMESKNGTFINKRLTQSSAIKPNDYIAVGSHLFLVKSIDKLRA
jgi:pSer/pThr/pTyr-binding forkhead associated (FHA) protein